MPVALGRSRIMLVCLAAAATLSGCKDAPTAPHALELLAGGQSWVAITPPADLPTAATWLPYLGRSGPRGRAAAGRVRTLQQEADQARALGHFDRSSALRQEAGRVAVAALGVNPDPEVLRRAGWAVDDWLQRVTDSGLADSPMVVDQVGRVRVDRDAARGALERGDTLAAAARLVAAAERIRHWSPEEIAGRALAHAEQRIRIMPRDGAEYERARHLVQGARQELIDGDPLRALQRVVYALQLQDGGQLKGTEGHEPGECVEKSC